MSRTVYVNGEYLPEEQAKVSVFDRACLFADAVYEVSAVLGGRLVDNAAHLARLQRSLGEMRIPMPVPPEAIERDNRASAIAAAGCHEEFFARHEAATAESVIDYLAFDRGNPSSICNCIETSRRNARAALSKPRTARTRIMR